MADDQTLIRLHELDLLTRDVIWETREGRQLGVQEMTDSHIINALQVLANTLEEYDRTRWEYSDFEGDLLDKVSLLESEQERRQLLQPKRGLGRLFGGRQ